MWRKIFLFCLQQNKAHTVLSLASCTYFIMQLYYYQEKQDKGWYNYPVEKFTLYVMWSIGEYHCYLYSTKLYLEF